MSWPFSFKIDLRGGPECVMHLKRIMTLNIFGAFIPAKCLTSNMLTAILVRMSSDC